jgi:hypothetical protein
LTTYFFLFFHNRSSASSTSRCIEFLLLRPIIRGATGSDVPWPAEQLPLAVIPDCTRRYWVRCVKLQSHQQESLISPWCCSTVLSRIPTCLSLRGTQYWRLSGLFWPPICKCRCGARTISHVHPQSAAEGAQATQTLRRSRNHWSGCVTLTSSCWLEVAVWSATSPLKPNIWRMAMGGYSHGRGIKSQVSGVGLHRYVNNCLWFLEE